MTPMELRLTPDTLRRTKMPSDIVLSVSLRVSGRELDPANVTGALGRLATSSAKRGDTLRKNGPHQLVTDEGVWFSELQSLEFRSSDQLAEQAILAPELKARLERVSGIEDMQLSFLLNGSERTITPFLTQNMDTLAKRIGAEAEYISADLDIPTLGIDTAVGVGQKLDIAKLRRLIALSSEPTSS